MHACAKSPLSSRAVQYRKHGVEHQTPLIGPHVNAIYLDSTSVVEVFSSLE
jgi:hypothetical protein